MKFLRKTAVSAAIATTATFGGWASSIEAITFTSGQDLSLKDGSMAKVGFDLASLYSSYQTNTMLPEPH